MTTPSNGTAVVIELGMVKFDYLPDGSIAGLRDVFTASRSV
jgi:hypothetical protein